MALPALADVRRTFPEARLAVAARAKVAPLYSWVPDADDVLVLKEGRGIARWIPQKNVERLKQGGFDVAVLLPNSFHSAWLARRAGVKERWGYRRDCRGPLLTRAVRHLRARTHQSAYYQGLTAALGMSNGPAIARLSPPIEAEGKARDLLKRRGWDGEAPLVGMAPGAAYGHAKRWLPERFAELAVLVAGDGGASVLVGSGGDRQAGRAIAAALGGRMFSGRQPGEGTPVVDLIGQTDLETLAGVMRSCRVFVSNDSGAMHLAAALGVHVVAIFGASDEMATAPLPFESSGCGHTIVTASAWCRPCMLRECPIDHRCMSRIGAGRVFEVVRGWIRTEC